MSACATWAIWRSRGSFLTAPISCKPIGKPDDEVPQGMEIAGMPAKFAGRFSRKSKARVA